MQYYQGLKIEEAKRLLDKNERVTAVSEKLSFESPQYFAKVFKQRVGKTPTEYTLLKNNDNPSKT
jgi:AraC-like DNA-binding protein